MKTSTKIAYNTIIQIVNKILVTSIGLLTIGLITRNLGTEGFGKYTTVITFLSFFGIMADLGLTLVSSQLLSQSHEKKDEKRMLGNLLAFRLVSAILFLGLVPITVIFFPYPPEIKLGIILTVSTFLFIALNQVMIGFFQKQLRMDKIAISELLSKIILIIGITINFKQLHGLNGVLIVTAASSAVNFFLNYFFSKKLLPYKLHFDKKIWKKIITLSWPLAITTSLNLIYLKSDTLLLSITPRESEIGIIAEVGIYGAAYKVIDVIITFPFMFAGIILPVITKLWVDKKIEKLKYTIQKSFDIMMIIAIPITIGTQFLSTKIMILVAGENFALSGPILQILILACGLIFFGIIPTHALIAISKQKKLIPFYFFTAITSLIGYLILIKTFSYHGAAIITVYSEIIVAFTAIYLVKKYLNFIPSLKTSLKALFASAIMSLFLVATSNFFNNLFYTLCSSIIVYFIALIAFKGINKDDFKIILNKK